MSDPSGLTLVELLVVVAIATVLAVTTVFFTVPMLAKETMRSAVNDAHAALQLTKIEAASRNRSCRFVVDTAQGTLEVWDTVNTTSRTDDVQLYSMNIPESVAFDRPDSGSVVTLQQIGTSDRYETVVTSDGIVDSGTGDVCMAGGGRFARLSVHAAGGAELSYWDGTAWKAGT